MDTQKKQIKGLAIAGIVLTAIYMYYSIRLLIILINPVWSLVAAKNSGGLTDDEFITQIFELISKNAFRLTILSLVAIARFVIIILLALKATSSTNKILYIVGIFVNPCAFIACILELVNLNKKNINQSPNNQQTPNNYPTNSSSNDSNSQNPHDYK